jgi:hypothetical protein
VPLYKVAYRFAWDIVGVPARKWSTTLFLDSVSPLAAANLARDTWSEVLADGARERVYLYEVYATDLDPASDSYVTVGVPAGAQRGRLPTPGFGGQPYLPKVCLAVTLGVSGSRPSRKFWRPGIYEGDVENGVGVDPVLVNAVTVAWDNATAAFGSAFVDPDGQNIFGVTRVRLTTREFGAESQTDVPLPPPLG